MKNDSQEEKVLGQEARQHRGNIKTVIEEENKHKTHERGRACPCQGGRARMGPQSLDPQ